LFIKLADTLPSKTIPLTSSGATRRRTHGQNKKRKGPSNINLSKSKKHRLMVDDEEDQGPEHLATNLAAPTDTTLDTPTPLSTSIQRTSSMRSVSSSVSYNLVSMVVSHCYLLDG
jgi:hypothetical protein